MTRVLITNDDGITSPGLLALAQASAAAGYETVIAAPSRQSSGTSASIAAEDDDGRIVVDPHVLDGWEHDAHAVHGGPGLIALVAARGAFGTPPDVVLSGVNHGANVGRAILHSGTVGAALTAGLNGARAIAVSLDVGMHPTVFHWQGAADTAVGLIPDLLRLRVGAVLNLNVPNAVRAHGVREARLAPFGIVQTTLTSESEHHVRLAVEDLPNEPEPGTDAAWLADGWTTVTALDPVSEIPLGFSVDAMVVPDASARKIHSAE